MFNLIPQIILFLALGIIVALIIKNIPKVKDLDEEEKHEFKEDFFEKQHKLFNKIPVEKINDVTNNVIEKILRRMRIVIIKLDSLIQRNLNSIKDSSKPKNIFKVDDDVKAGMSQNQSTDTEPVGEVFIPESSFDVVDVHERITIDNKEVAGLDSSEIQIEDKPKRGRKKK